MSILYVSHRHTNIRFPLIYVPIPTSNFENRAHFPDGRSRKRALAANTANEVFLELPYQLRLPGQLVPYDSGIFEVARKCEKIIVIYAINEPKLCVRFY